MFTNSVKVLWQVPPHREEVVVVECSLFDSIWQLTSVHLNEIDGTHNNIWFMRIFYVNSNCLLNIWKAEFKAFPFIGRNWAKFFRWRFTIGGNVNSVHSDCKDDSTIGSINKGYLSDCIELKIKILGNPHLYFTKRWFYRYDRLLANPRNKFYGSTETCWNAGPVNITTELLIH